MPQCFEGLIKLRKLRVINREISHTRQAGEKMSDLVRPPGSPVVYYRGDSLYNVCYVSGPWPGAQAFNIIRQLRAVKWHLTKLRIDAIYWTALSANKGLRDVPVLQHLLSLHLRVTTRFEHQWADESCTTDNVQEIRRRLQRARQIVRKHHFMAFLAQLKKLQSLKLEFDKPSPGQLYFEEKPFRLGDIFCENHTWPDLRRLSLRKLDTMREDLWSLMRRQRSSLKVLKLHDICIEEPNRVMIETEPSEVLRGVHEYLTLERVKLSRCLCYMCGSTSEYRNWGLDDRDLGHDLAGYLVHGGTNPLNKRKECA